MAETKFSPKQIDTVALGQDSNLQSGIDHTGIANIGTNSHADIDVHIADTSKHLTGSPPTLPADSITYDNTVSGLVATDVKLAIDENAVGVSNRMRWNDVWVDGTYIANDVVRDGNWTMVANTTTTDRPSPQPLGEPEFSIDPNAIFDLAQNSSVLKMVHKYTTTKAGWLEKIQVRTPFWDTNVVSKISFINTTSATTQIFSDPILNNDAWTTLAINPTPYVAGTQFEIWFEYYNSNNTNNISGGWTSFIGAGTPAPSEFRIDNPSAPTVINIDHTDLDNVNRSTELDGVIAGSIFLAAETGDLARSVEVIVDSINTSNPSYTIYNVSLISVGSKGTIRGDRTCTIDIDIPIAKPSKYNVLPNYYSLGSPSNQPSFATVTSELYFNGVQQGGSPPNTTDAYGIDVRFQEASISIDWDLLAFAGDGGLASTVNEIPTMYNIDITTGVGSPLTILETKLPSGWTATYNAIGDFTITHNLNNTNVGIALNVIYNGTGRVLNPKTIVGNSITFQITDTLNIAVEGNIIGQLLF